MVRPQRPGARLGLRLEAATPGGAGEPMTAQRTACLAEGEITGNLRLDRSRGYADLGWRPGGGAPESRVLRERV